MERRRRLGAELLDNVLFAVSLACVVLLGIVYARQGVGWGARVSGLAVIWVLLTYFALPRFHRMMTALYVPDYFIGRARTSDGLLGDPVNLTLLGDAAAVHTAFARAGWTLADPLNARSTGQMITHWLRRRSYPDAPVSSLFLFGRVQDFAYQQEVDGTPSQRHHVRFWRVPEGWLLPGGRRVDWLAAGTFDRAVGFSLYTGQVTHKIDADTDAERDFVVASVRWGNPEATLDVIADFSTGYHARNGGGDAINTDGDLPILDVRAVPADEAASGLPAVAATPARRIGRRPVAVLAGVLLVAASTFLDLFVTWPLAAGEALRDLNLDAETYQGALVTVIVGGVLILALIGVLLAGTYAGRAGARMTLLVVLSLQLAAQLAGWVAATHVPVVALVSTTLAVLGVFLLSSLAARTWTAQRPRPTNEPPPG